MRHHIGALVLMVAAACSGDHPAKDGTPPSESRASAGWRDPSPHTVRRVMVAPGVSLEVLDWGGRGEPLLFLAGLGNTAHVFDDFAPQFTDGYHVLAITRRGFGASSQTASGYDIESRVRDLLEVLDSLGLQTVDLVGHSIAGDELTGFAARHPERVRRLVYLDAAYDHSTRSGASRPPLPAMTAADSASPAAVLAYASLLGQPLPEADLRATVVFGPNGRPVRDVTPGSTFGEIMKGLEHPPYSRVRAPALAFYSEYESPKAALSQKWWSSIDSSARKQTIESLAFMAVWSAKERKRFRAEVKSGTAIELPAANHFIWVTNGEQVVREMRAFLKRS